MIITSTDLEPCGLIAESKVEAPLAAPVGFMCPQDPLDSAVDLLPVGWTGLTGLGTEGNTHLRKRAIKQY